MFFAPFQKVKDSDCHNLLVLVCGSMRLLIIAAASLAVVSCASLSLEDLEFHAWKLKFGEEAQKNVIIYSCNQYVIEVFILQKISAIIYLLYKIHQNIFPSA